jgi:hypothetical protein
MSEQVLDELDAGLKRLLDEIEGMRRSLKEVVEK